MIEDIVRAVISVLALLVIVAIHTALIGSGLSLGLIFSVIYIINIGALGYFAFNATLKHMENKRRGV